METTDMSFDKIYIRDLLVRCIIGVHDFERKEKQDVIINIVLHADLSKPCKTDCIDDSVNYSTVKKRVISLTEESSYFLIERLADEIAAACLDYEFVREVTVTIDKPGALRFSRSVAVEITRKK